NLVLFSLPGPAPFTIHLLSALPAQTSPVIIDGWSQTGSNGPPVIELGGRTARNAIDGSVRGAGGAPRPGLAPPGLQAAWPAAGGATNTVQDNFIGTDLSGTNALGNLGDGIYIASSFNLVGGDGAGAANVISANSGSGIVFDTPNAANNTVAGNLIGLGADGV